MKIRKIITFFCSMIFLCANFSSQAEDNTNEKKECNWFKKHKEKRLYNFRSKLDSVKYNYPRPFLTIHLGVSYTTNAGNVQNNSGGIPGTMLDIRKDLGFSKSSILPRINAIVNFGNLSLIAFDMYNIIRRDNTTLSRDIRYGDATYLAGSPIKSRLSFNYFSLSYIHFFYNNGRARLAFLAGVTAITYSLRITNTSLIDFSQKKSLIVPLPTVGLNASYYVCKNLFIRATAKYSGWWFGNYNCNVIDVNPYFEYYIYKNLGLGMRYNFGYTNLKNLPDKKFDGSVKNTFNAISLVVVYRFLKKDSKG